MHRCMTLVITSSTLQEFIDRRRSARMALRKLQDNERDWFAYHKVSAELQALEYVLDIAESELEKAENELERATKQ